MYSTSTSQTAGRYLHNISCRVCSQTSALLWLLVIKWACQFTHFSSGEQLSNWEWTSSMTSCHFLALKSSFASPLHLTPPMEPHSFIGYCTYYHSPYLLGQQISLIYLFNGVFCCTQEDFSNIWWPSLWWEEIWKFLEATHDNQQVVARSSLVTFQGD